ncbi:arabinogalactan oligomer/maltooligosaccharide transport system permease protein [Kineococcus xinjiangensis]|uniref:Maltose/maltodextrin transport system permease protein n=1 Tax=Kineococcus xinjiangensis TaxID=512762 RepID=A0A2S6IDY8_9ACTN|nr:ABC transporter permease subunit [Kineococcus xinjiangensis]PPK92432.1 arabinogalactan oligomer/maltooligosaccharide transport system permease protein [Kineococcus xinjiangensis]
MPARTHAPTEASLPRTATAGTGPDGPGRKPAPAHRSLSATTIAIRVALLGAVAAVVVWLVPVLVAQERWIGLAGLLLGAAALGAVYSTSRLVPAKYLLPGTLFLLALIIYPIIATLQLSFTNFGDGKRGTKEEAIASIIGSSVEQLPDSPVYALSVGTQGSTTDGPFTFFLVDAESGEVSRGDAEGLVDVPADEVEVAKGRVVEADGYTILTPREVNAAGPVVQEFTVPTENGAIRAQGVARAFEGRTALQYDEAADRIIDTRTGESYGIGLVGDSEFFVKEDGAPAFSQSWLQGVGTANYERIFTNDVIIKDFLRIFAWTLAFAALSVGLAFGLGLALAVILNDSRIRGQRLYRSLLILPYAVPAVIAILVWSSFYNRDFGLINETLGMRLDWFGDPWLAKAAILLTGTWMGYPYMFIVCTGALQSVPSELREAAVMDGARPFTAFRKIILPLLMVPVAPLLVASFAFNFNNFNLIALLTEGGPFTADNPYAGGTDILISYTYRLAFGGAGAQFGFAAAVSVLLFILTAVIAAGQFRATRALEDVN